MNRRFLLPIVVFIAAAGFGMFALYKASSMPKHVVSIGGADVDVELATTTAAREHGLSDHAPLAPNSGMLFVFASDNTWGFWMKDMLYPLDIIWFDANGKVITVAVNLSPDTYPQAFYPATPARYVLEVPAGFAAAHTIATGMQAVMPADAVSTE